MEPPEPGGSKRTVWEVGKDDTLVSSGDSPGSHDGEAGVGEAGGENSTTDGATGARSLSLDGAESDCTEDSTTTAAASTIVHCSAEPLSSEGFASDRKSEHSLADSRQVR